MALTIWHMPMEPLTILILAAFIASLALTALMAAASHARTGLRGRRFFLWSGFGLGLVAGGVELVIAVQLSPISRLVGALGQSLWFEIAVEATIAAMTYLVVITIFVQLGLFLRRRTARRRGDVVALAAGLGCGVALTATAFRLGFAGIWPPSVLFVAVIYPPVQLCFALLLGASTLALRDGLGWPSLGWQLMAVLLQGGYQFVLRVNASVGHWLAWLEPAQISIIWLGLIILAWVLGMAVMHGLGRAEPAPAYRELDPDVGLLRPRLWLWLAGLVLVPTALVLVASFYVELDVRTAWVMILALLATPLMVGAVLLRTAFTLTRGSGAAAS